MIQNCADRSCQGFEQVWQSEPLADYSEVADHLAAGAAGRELRAGSQPTETASGWPRHRHCLCHCCTVSCLRKPSAHLRSLGNPPCASGTGLPPRCSTSRADCPQWPASPACPIYTTCHQMCSIGSLLARATTLVTVGPQDSSRRLCTEWHPLLSRHETHTCCPAMCGGGASGSPMTNFRPVWRGSGEMPHRPTTRYGTYSTSFVVLETAAAG